LTIPRIYSPHALEKGKLCRLDHDNFKYLKHVLRLQPGAAITVFDGFGHEFAAVIRDFPANGVDVELGEKKETVSREIKITLAQALPKAHKMDFIVRTAAELGTAEIIPFTAHRSVSRIDGEKSLAKTARWQKIAGEAARCCRSTQITVVRPVASLETMLASAARDALKMIFWEEEDIQNIKDILTDQTRAVAKDIFIIVGPEGGLTREEVNQAKSGDFISVSLGRQILKVESAAPAIIAIIQYEKGIFSKTRGR